MSEHRGGEGTFDASDPHPSGRRVKPRLVFILLLGASLAGIWVSHWGNGVPARLVRWGIVVAGGILVGGLYWRLALFDGNAFDDAESYQAVQERWRWIETATVWLLVTCGLAGLGFGRRDLASELGALGFFTGSVLSLLIWFSMGYARRRESWDTVRMLRTLLLLVSLAIVAGSAWLETGTELLQWLVRLGHLGAFSLWVGGATWHNFVVLPTIQSHPSTAGVLKQQARRFRRHLPVVVLLLFLTGLFQVMRLFGTSVEGLLGTTIGLVVVAKVLVLATLTGFVVLGFRRGPD